MQPTSVTNFLNSWLSPRQLRNAGILGMNCRNVDFISRYNPRRYYPLVDDKLQTKLLAEEHGVPTPKLQFVVRSQYEISHVEKRLLELDNFVIKPSRGSGGKGILVIKQRQDEHFIKSSGSKLNIEDIRRHLSNTLAGLYSLRGSPDVAIIEDLIEFDTSFDDYSYEGVPDIRIIVFRGYPVMAMLRLATHASDGKANLHQGAVGVGIDIPSGRSLNAVQFSRPISHHPDTHKALDTLQVPNWEKLLELAASCYEMSNLGYIGTDIVLSKTYGAQLLELNARPGLAIQIANGQGLLPRLRHIESLRKMHKTPYERVQYMKQYLLDKH